jgi:hypothetical protein
MKRLKHKEKFKPRSRILCNRCNLADVTDDDPEMECICKECWKEIEERNRREGRKVR